MNLRVSNAQTIMQCGIHSTLVLALFLSCLHESTHSQPDFTLSTVQRTGENFRNWLIRQHNNYTHVDILKKNMHGAIVSGIEPRVERDRAKDAILDLLNRKREAVQRMVTVLENATIEYLWSDKVEANFSSVLYMNGTEEEVVRKLFNSSLTADPMLGGSMTLRSIAGVHIPVEVYQGYPEIINGIAWSKCLDDVFFENAANDFNISWQYFASSVGFTRIFPAAKWTVPAELEGADLYDARRRPWFVRGSTLPKDIIILMDKSGSVHGQTLTIMKFAVKTLINTLGEDDFLNVAMFNETTHWIMNCTDALDGEDCQDTATLMQATTDNKMKLFRVIDEITDQGMTNFTGALEFAYEKLLEHAEEVGPGGGNCHRLIMFFSDGGTDNPEDLLMKYQNRTDTRNIRIFSYAIGPHPVPTYVLKNMACTTGGLFTGITSTSGIRNLIQESFLPSLWRTEFDLRHSDGEYLCAQNSNDTEDVFQNSTDPNNDDNTLLNESYIHHLAKPPPKGPKDGTRIPSPFSNTPYIDHMTEKLSIAITQPVYNRSSELPAKASPLVGVAGVDLPIDEIESIITSETLGPTGYFFLVNHNGFVAMHPKLKSRHFYLQDPPDRDLLDLEWPSHKIDEVRRRMVEGKSDGVTLIKHKHLLTDERHLVSVNDDFQYWFLPLRGTTYSLGMVVRNRSQHLSVPQNNDPSFSFDIYTSKLPHWVLPNEPTPRSGLVWSERWTKEMVLKWRQNNIFTTVADKLISFTRFGLTRFHAEAMTWPAWLKAWLDPRHNPSLIRGEFGEQASVFPTPEGNILMTAPVKLKGLVLASVGLNFYNEFIREGFLNELTNSQIANTLDSLVLDDGAFVVISQIDKLHTGSFLGDDLGGKVLLDYLVEKDIYTYVTYMDQQAICGLPPPTIPDDVSSSPILRPLFRTWTDALTTINGLLTFIKQFYYVIIGALLSILSTPVSGLTEYGIVSFDDQEEQPCVMKRTVYTWGSVNNSAIPVTCGLEKGEVLVSRIEDTNMLLVSISGCPVEKAMEAVPDEESDSVEDSHNGRNTSDFFYQKIEVTRFRETFSSRVTMNLPEGPEEERLPETRWCCATLFRRNIRACKRSGLPSNNTCSNAGLTVRGHVTSVTPIAALASSLGSIIMAAYFARF